MCSFPFCAVARKNVSLGQGEVFDKAATINAAVLEVWTCLGASPLTLPAANRGTGRAGSDLGPPSDHGEKWLLRMLCVSQLTLSCTDKTLHD